MIAIIKDGVLGRYSIYSVPESGESEVICFVPIGSSLAKAERVRSALLDGGYEKKQPAHRLEVHYMGCDFVVTKDQNNRLLVSHKDDNTEANDFSRAAVFGLMLQRGLNVQ